MNYISTTELRKKASVLKDSLRRGESVYLLHRSKVIGVVEPYIQEDKPATLKQLRKFISAFSSKDHIPDSQRRELYQAHLEDKYGKSVS